MYSSLSSNHRLSMDNPDSLTLESALEMLEWGSFEEQWTIAKVLVKYGDVVIPPLKSVILDENKDNEHRWYALKVLSQLQNPEIILIISDLLATTTEDDLISLATQTLASQGKKAITALTPLLSIPQYRLSVTKALAQIPHRDVVESLLSVVNDDNVDVRVSAIASLHNFDTPAVINTLTKALQDYHSIVRKEAVIGLSLKTKSAPAQQLASLIIPFLQDIDLNVCQQAAISLSRFPIAPATEALYTTLVNQNTPIPLQKTIVKALAWQETSLSIEYLAKALYLMPESIIIEIIALLGRSTNKKNYPQIIQLTLQYYDRNSFSKQSLKIIQNLCYTWQKLNAKEAIKILEEMANQGDNIIKFHSQSALNKLRK